MIIIHSIFSKDSLTDSQLRLIDSLNKKKIISVVKVKGKVGISRSGTNRGKKSQLYKYVRES